jgi:hypothetical protein
LLKFEFKYFAVKSFHVTAYFRNVCLLGTFSTHEIYKRLPGNLLNLEVIIYRTSQWSTDCTVFVGLGVMVFNATFNNISVIPWSSVLLVEFKYFAAKLFHVTVYFRNVCLLGTFSNHEIYKKKIQEIY